MRGVKDSCNNMIFVCDLSSLLSFVLVSLFLFSSVKCCHQREIVRSSGSLKTQCY